MQHNAVAVVASAGLGTRFGASRNKPFETLGGKPVLIWSLEVFQSMPEVTEIIPVLKESDIFSGKELFESYGLSKIKGIATGGRERQDSVYSGLSKISDSESVVIIHDGVRPLVRAESIRAALAALNDCDGVVIGVVPKDTIKEINGSMVGRTLHRSSLIAVQTPQIFRYRPLMNAYRSAMDDGHYATDDAALIEKYGGCVSVVPGDYTNIKVTTPEDIVIAEALLELRMEGR